MTEKITKLDNKYLVVKIKDLNDFLNTEERQTLASLLIKVDGARRQKGKPINDYVVLNLDDEVSMSYLNARIQDTITKRMHAAMFENKHNEPLYIRDIAVDLVNAILKAKKGQDEM